MLRPSIGALKNHLMMIGRVAYRAPAASSSPKARHGVGPFVWTAFERTTDPAETQNAANWVEMLAEMKECIAADQNHADLVTVVLPGPEKRRSGK